MPPMLKTSRLFLVAAILALPLWGCSAKPAKAGPFNRIGRGVGRVETAPVRFVRNRCGGNSNNSGCGSNSNACNSCSN